MQIYFAEVILWYLFVEGVDAQNYCITMALLLQEEDNQNDYD